MSETAGGRRLERLLALFRFRNDKDPESRDLPPLPKMPPVPRFTVGFHLLEETRLERVAPFHRHGASVHFQQEEGLSIRPVADGEGCIRDNPRGAAPATGLQSDRPLHRVKRCLAGRCLEGFPVVVMTKVDAAGACRGFDRDNDIGDAEVVTKVGAGRERPHPGNARESPRPAGDQLLPSTFGQGVADVLILGRLEALAWGPLQKAGMVEPAESPDQMLGTATYQSDDVARPEEPVNRYEFQNLVVPTGQAKRRRESSPTEP